MVAASRFFFAAKPGLRTLSSLERAFAPELARLHQSELFRACYWHQSLSTRCFNPKLLDVFISAGSLIQATVVRMLFNRIRRNGDHWEILTQGTPEGFHALSAAVRNALLHVGIVDPMGHGPHITISYWATTNFEPRKKIDPVEWTIDEVLLLEGGGYPFQYDIRGRWPLLPLKNPQLNLWA